MKVIYQEWRHDGMLLSSISKNLEQYRHTVERVSEQTVPVNMMPLDAEIPDDSQFVEMLEDDTVFLEEDERYTVTVF